MPCIHPECAEKHPEATLGQTTEDYCTICYVQGLGEKPCVQLDCKHIFHFDCIMQKLSNKWPGPRIVFNFLNCSSCKKRIRAGYCEPLTKLVCECEDLEEDIKNKALQRAKFEDLDKEERLKNPADRYYNNLQQYAIDALSYYSCYKCK